MTNSAPTLEVIALMQGTTATWRASIRTNLIMPGAGIGQQVTLADQEGYFVIVKTGVNTRGRWVELMPASAQTSGVH
ncbi:hypothetical protein [Deinococcus sonorensis]|uniref:Uncharacterized protein n=2 Tax=Deinococcus sonorensis TaxID=309891 RepID=A0AAU7UBS6_9DEIO